MSEKGPGAEKGPVETPSESRLVVESPIYFVSANELDSLVQAGDRSGARLKRVDARRWDNEKQIHRDLASALRLPDYFGHNWDALEECLNDPALIGPPGVYLIVEYSESLWNGLPRSAGILVAIWIDAAKTWAAMGHPLRLYYVIGQEPGNADLH